jgi:hypothetical protein
VLIPCVSEYVYYISTAILQPLPAVSGSSLTNVISPLGQEVMGVLGERPRASAGAELVQYNDVDKRNAADHR